MVSLLIPTAVADRILQFAVHQTYSFEDALLALHALPVECAPNIALVAIHRHVPARLLAALGNVDALRTKISGMAIVPVFDCYRAAARTGQVSVLAFLETATGKCPDSETWAEIVSEAVEHDHTDVISRVMASQRTAASSSRMSEYVAMEALQCGRLDMARAALVQCGQHSVPPKYIACLDFSRARAQDVITVLDWCWAAHLDPPVRAQMISDQMQHPIQMSLSRDDGPAVMEWWWSRYSEIGGATTTATWPHVGHTLLTVLIQRGHLRKLEWWYVNTQRTGLGFDMSNKALDTMCERERVDFLDWFWQKHLMSSSGDDSGNGGIDFDSTWRPKRRFVHASVAAWWQAKVESGLVDKEVLLLSSQDDIGAWMTFFMTADVGALIWWSQHLALADKWAGVSESATEYYAANGQIEHLQYWHSHAQSFQFSEAALMAAARNAQVNVLEWARKHCSLAWSGEFPVLESDLDEKATAVLDWLWDRCTGLGMKPIISETCLRAAAHQDRPDFQLTWLWYRHLICGTPFLTASEIVDMFNSDRRAVLRKWVMDYMK